MRKNVFTERAVRHRTRLRRAVGESPSLEGFKTCVDVAVTVGLDDLRGLFQT